MKYLDANLTIACLPTYVHKKDEDQCHVHHAASGSNPHSAHHI